jgi:multidrug transporter EmrE-like cation transporter
VPGILAVGAAIMVTASIVIFHETFSWERALGVLLSIAAIVLLKRN